MFDWEKFLVIFTVILCSTSLNSILSGVRYVCEQTCNVTFFSYVVFLFFFPVKCHSLPGFCRTHFFVISKFLPKIILLCQAVQFAFITTRRRRYSPVCQILQLPYLSSLRKEGWNLFFFSLIIMVITVETRGVCKTSSYFLCLKLSVLTAHDHRTCIQHLEHRRTVPVWLL